MSHLYSKCLICRQLIHYVKLPIWIHKSHIGQMDAAETSGERNLFWNTIILNVHPRLEEGVGLFLGARKCIRARDANANDLLHVERTWIHLLACASSSVHLAVRSLPRVVRVPAGEGKLLEL